MKQFHLPDLGEGLPDAEIVEWHVKEGDHVTVDQPMVSMETAKAVVDVPSPFTGTVVKLHGQPGDVIDTGAVLVTFDVDGDASAPESPAADKPAPAAKEEIGELIDELEETLPKVAPEVASATPAETPREDTGTVVGEMESTGKVVSDVSTVGNVKVTPAVRALAKKLKVDLNRVKPSGAGGVVTARDVRLAAESGQAASPAAPRSQTATPSTPRQASLPMDTAPVQKTPAHPSAQPAQQSDGQWQQVKGPRRSMARAMAQAHAEVVPTTLMDDADINDWKPGQDITYRLIRALVAGSRVEPVMNAWFDGKKLAIRKIPHVDVGIAVDTPDGLFVPTLRNAETLGQPEVRAAMNRIKEQVRNRSIPPEEMKDFTIMLSNFGVFAGRYATPVVTPPCVCIVGAGKLRYDAIPVMGGFEAHRIIPISLTFDHRAATGGEASRFFAAVLKDLSLPE
jgi:pyruvate dehydrogenase E2 component (dihydrolipoamide acetyltransferase)